MGRLAVFVDRDGVINANRADHVLSWDEFEFLPGALKGLALLKAASIPVVVVTNQAVVGKGHLRPEALEAIHERMRAAVLAAGGELLDVLYCPHDAAAGCECRKPKPGLFHTAAERHTIDLASSYYVGDALTDMVAGQAVGCTCIFVQTGRGRTQLLREEARLVRNYHRVGGLLDGARWIVAQQGTQRPGPMATLRLRLQRRPATVGATDSATYGR